MYKKATAATVNFLLVNKTNGGPVVSGTVQTSCIKDGGVPYALTGATHEYNGVWSIGLTSGDMDADVVTIAISNADAVPTMMSINTAQFTAGQIYAGITEIQNGVNVTQVAGNTVTGFTDFMASTSGLSTFDPSVDAVTVGNTVAANIVSVAGFQVTSTADFKADTSGITASVTGTINANIVQVASSAISNISEFFGSTAGLSTFDHTTDRVILATNSVNADALASDAVAQITADIFGQTVDSTVTMNTVMSMLLAFMAGKVQVTDNGTTRTIVYYKRDGTTSSFSITASEVDSQQGQRSSTGTIT